MILDFGFGFDLVFLADLGLGSGLFSVSVRKYSFLRVPILVLIFLSSFISSSVAGLSSGKGIVYLLYSSLSFKLICVSLWRI